MKTLCAATSAKVTALHTTAKEEREVQDYYSTTGLGELLQAAQALEAAAHDAYNIYRQGLRFEKSGDSMAVYDGQFRIDRVTLADDRDATFVHAVDVWLWNRYMAEVA